MLGPEKATCWTVQTMPLADADDALTAEWRDLNEASADPCPFKSPDFVLPSSNLNDQPIQLITIRNRQTESLDGLLATTDARPDKFLGLEDASRKGEGGSSMHRTVVDQCHIHDAHSVSGHTRHGPHSSRATSC